MKQIVSSGLRVVFFMFCILIVVMLILYADCRWMHDDSTDCEHIVAAFGRWIKGSILPWRAM